MVSSTQQSVPIAGVKDGIIVLKNGGYRMILEISAINFSLKSEQEQNSLVFQYQSFLNSLHFPIQIVIKSKLLDLSPYLNKVKQASDKSLNELIKTQIEDYIDFVGKLVSVANIMKKSFYIIIPYDPISVKKLNILDNLFTKGQKFDHLKISDAEFKSSTDQITERANVVASSLGSMGLHCFQLSTEEILELFYQIYNPEEAMKERLDDPEKISSPVVASANEIGPKNIQENPKDNDNTMQRSVDNESLVLEQQKQAANLRRQESSSAEEKGNDKENNSLLKPQSLEASQTTGQPQPQPSNAQINDLKPIAKEENG